MSDDIGRSGNGQFARGQSGNPEGARTRRRKELMNSEDISRTILRVAGSRTQMMINGKTEDVTMLEVNLWGLASGKTSNRLASKDFVELAKDAGGHLDTLERRAIQREHSQRMQQRGR